MERVPLNVDELVIVEKMKKLCGKSQICGNLFPYCCVLYLPQQKGWVQQGMIRNLFLPVPASARSFYCYNMDKIRTIVFRLSFWKKQQLSVFEIIISEIVQDKPLGYYNQESRNTLYIWSSIAGIYRTGKVAGASDSSLQCCSAKDTGWLYCISGYSKLLD